MLHEAHQIILAPHPDDEIIGCYDVVRKPGPVTTIILGRDMGVRIEQAKRLQNIRAQYQVRCGYGAFVTLVDDLKSHDVSFEIHAPHPITETHPLHREVGHSMEELARIKGYTVIWYTTEMNVPWKYEVGDPEHKRQYLDKTYPEQRDLWRFEHKYFLFEGHCQWRVDLCRG